MILSSVPLILVPQQAANARRNPPCHGPPLPSRSTEQHRNDIQPPDLPTKTQSASCDRERHPKTPTPRQHTTTSTTTKVTIDKSLPGTEDRSVLRGHRSPYLLRTFQTETLVENERVARPLQEWSSEDPAAEDACGPSPSATRGANV